MPDPRGLIPAIVLTAGLSSRMGRNKLLIEIEGTPLVQRVINTLHATGLRHIIVVTGHQAELVRASCSQPAADLQFVHNPAYESGRASSVQAGLRAVPSGSGAVLIMPGDVPFVKAELIQRLLAQFAAHGRITFPLCNGAKGHPVIFPASSFHLLQSLAADETLHDYLLDNPGETHPVETDDPGCLRDIDSPEDLE
jgi:molybdenum cofactor cytidylyltransferase